MLGELAEELGIAARVLVEILHAGRASAVSLADLGHPGALDLCGGPGGLLLELLALVGRGAGTATSDDERGGARRIGEAEMKDGKTAHRDPDDMRLLDL